MTKRLLIVPALLLALTAVALAEDPPKTDGTATATETSTATDTGEPPKKTDIVADQMEILDEQNRAIFTGKVDLRRADVHWTSDTMTIDYEKVAQPDGSNKTEVKTVDSKGNVRIVTKSQTITSEWAKMDVKANKLQAGGNVKVVQGKSILTGDLLNSDLNTNVSQMSGGRVKGSFLPN